jgi:spermidine/putrescine transport system ATP-binding protein
MNVAENVAFGLCMQHAEKEDIRKGVKEALELVNMARFGDRRVTDLSAASSSALRWHARWWPAQDC